MTAPTRCHVRQVILSHMLVVVLAGWSPALVEAADNPSQPTEIVGTVVDQSGGPAVGVLVSLTPVPPVDGAALTTTADTVTSTTDADGRFVITIEAPAPSYRIAFEGKGYAPYDGVIQVQAGERAEYNVTILDAETRRRKQAIAAFNAAVDALKRSDDETARSELTRATELDPELPEPHLGLAQLAYRQSRLEAARTAVERYLELRPNDAKGLALALAVATDLGDQERVAALTEALAGTADPKVAARIAFNQGVEALNADDRVLAMEKMERAVELDPTLARAHSTLGVLYFNAGRYPEALTAAKAAFELDPSDPQSQRVRYLSQVLLGDEAGAAASLEAFIAVDPEGAVEVMYRQASAAFDENGPSAEVTTLLERVLSLDPDHPGAHLTLGLCYVGTDPARARTHLERFLELAPEDPEAASAREILSLL